MEANTLEYLESDDYLRKFTASGLKNDLANNLSLTEQVKKLGEGIEYLTKELQKHVLDKHDDLLRQAHHANNLENILITMNTHVENLFANADRLKLQISAPYQALETHTKVLGRLHLASHILRQVNRIQQLSKRLTNTNDTIQKAVILQELQQLAADPDLVDIDVVNTELRNLRTQQHKVMQLAKGLLNQGLSNENSTQTSTALQIYINLGNVKSHLSTFIEISLGECRESLKSAFEVAGVASNVKSKGPGRVTLTSSQGFRIRIWNDLEKAFNEEIYEQCKRIKFLQIALNNLNVRNVDCVIAAEFWISLNNIIGEEINNSSQAVRQMLEEEYPKLLKNYADMVKKLNCNDFLFMRSNLEKCENSYLSNSLSCLLENTQTIFNIENMAPQHDQIEALCGLMTNEISVALVEENLSAKTAKNIAKCIKMFSVKTEQQISSGPEAAQVIGGAPNSGQQLNLQLANSMYYFKIQIQRILTNMKETLSEKCVSIINESLTSLDGLTSAIIQPLIASINATIETIIITIHLETDWSKLSLSHNKHSITCSPYMKELNQFITRVYQIYLSSFDNKEVLNAKCREIALRCIDLLVRHSTLIRPVSPGGRMRLQADYLSLEQSLKVICPNLPDLGQSYRLFKSMATLITLTPKDIVESHASGSSVPHSIILLFLFSFAGKELASPHQNTGWSLQKLSTWLDEHPNESDRLDLIAGALQRYVTVIRQKNSTTYDEVYPIMSEFLESALKK